MLTADDIVQQLRTVPVDVDRARAATPKAPGLYAWWVAPGALPGITGPRHPSGEVGELAYVGIASDLRRRVGGNHIAGRTGQSTLRRGLAALLLTSERFTTRRQGSKVVLVPDDEIRLSDWMRRHLRVSWTEHPEPALVEEAVIARMGSPMNVAFNRAHPLYPVITAARSAYRASADS